MYDKNNFAIMAKEETNALYANGNFTKPNSKEAFTKQGAKIQVNALAFKLPTIKFKNKELEKQWETILENNNILELIQKLEALTFRHGRYALGFFKKDNGLFFRITEIIDYKQEGAKLIYLKVKEENFTKENRTYYQVKEYFDKFNNPWVRGVFYEADTKTKAKNQSELQLVNDYLELNSMPFIPYVIFKNNYESKSEIEGVDPSLFETLNNCYEMLLRDNYHSSPFIFTETASKSSSTVQNTQNAVYNFDKRIITASVQDSLYSSDGVPLTFYQGNSISQSILAKIDKLIFLIKDQMFFKFNSADFGTKNMHNSETENLNSSYSDMLESKANLREFNYRQFIYLVLKSLNLNLTISDIDITVPGSTKYLKSKEAEYLFNQDGVNLNPNLMAKNNNQINQLEETPLDKEKNE